MHIEPAVSGPDESPASNRIAAIDGLRAVGFAAIFLFHALTWFKPLGTFGVDLFFVVSGFVITRSLISAEPPTLSQFYIKRFRRILPALLVLCAVMAAARAAGWSHVTYFDVLAAALSFMNWALALHWTEFGALGHAWSLSVEEQFYLVWPVLALFAPRRFLVPLLIATVIGANLWRLQFSDHFRIVAGFDTHCDGLALGALLAIIRPKLPVWWLAIPLSLPFLLLVLNPSLALSISAGTFASGIAVAVASQHRLRLLEWAPIQWAGSRSYSLYLWHMPILIAVGETGMRDIYRLTLSVLLTVVAAEASFSLVERRFSKSLLLLRGRRPRSPDQPMVDEPGLAVVQERGGS
jgi:peptidoglycan/LPS O-acetylase OafA/YrhL